MSSVYPGQFISRLTISRWGYESMITLSDIGKAVAADPCFQEPAELREQLTESQKKRPV